MLGNEKGPQPRPGQIEDAMNRIQGILTCQKCGAALTDGPGIEYGADYVSPHLQFRVASHKCGTPVSESAYSDALERCRIRLRAFREENPQASFADQQRAYTRFLDDEHL